jgi:putative ABC transport system permease protein
VLQFFRRLHYFLNQGRFDGELQDDMEFHREMAKQHGRSNFGNLLRLREDAREAWGWTWIDRVIQDLRFAMRMGRRNPLYSAFVILILSIGIGGNIGMFTIVNSVLVRPLPYPGDDRLFVATETIPREQLTNDQVSYPLFLDWQSESRTLEALGAYFVTSDVALVRNSASHQQIAYASASLFPTLGVAPIVGRTFLRDDTRSTDAHTVVISEEFWREHFDASRDIIGKTIAVGADVYGVIGVLPSRSSYVAPGVNLWLPIEPMARLPFMRNRDVCFLTVVSRLRRGAKVYEALAELSSIQKRDQISFPGVDAGHGVHLQTLRDFIVGPRGRSLIILGAAMFCLLLLVCANVGGLMMERSAARQGEFAMRRALGAPRSRIVRQVLTESLLLATLGGVLGLVASRFIVFSFLVAGATLIPDANPISYDLHVWWFSAAAVLLTSIVAGFGPALTMWGSSNAERLKDLAGTRLCTPVRRGLRRWLVTTELALTVVLLCAASLLIVSFTRLSSVNPGFRTDHLLTASISLPAARYDTENSRVQFFDDLGRDLERLPGVAHVSAVSTLPINGGDSRGFVTIENHPFALDRQPSASFRRVLPNYFQLMGIPVLSGREFQGSDQGKENGRPMVVLINEQMAKELWPDRSPLGERIKIGPAENEPWLTIVGVVGDVHNTRLEAQPDFSTYEPFAQRSRDTMTIVVRTSLDPHSLEESVVSTIHRRETEAAIYDVMTMEERVASSVLNWKFNAWIIGAFGALALSLAVVGSYASISYSVRQRTPEIGLRMALGAQPRRVLADVLSEAIEIAITGLGIGTIAAFAVAHTIRSILFGVTGADPAIYGAVFVSVVLTILLAGLLPALHAAHIDPAQALRTQ